MRNATFIAIAALAIAGPLAPATADEPGLWCGL